MICTFQLGVPLILTSNLTIVTDMKVILASRSTAGAGFPTLMEMDSNLLVDVHLFFFACRLNGYDFFKKNSNM